MVLHNQCCGSMKFWSDLDPDPDPAIFVSDLHDVFCLSYYFIITIIFMPKTGSKTSGTGLHKRLKIRAQSLENACLFS
jgi:hypothetical protein